MKQLFCELAWWPRMDEGITLKIEAMRFLVMKIPGT